MTSHSSSIFYFFLPPFSFPHWKSLFPLYLLCLFFFEIFSVCSWLEKLILPFMRPVLKEIVVLFTDIFICLNMYPAGKVLSWRTGGSVMDYAMVRKEIWYSKRYLGFRIFLLPRNYVVSRTWAGGQIKVICIHCWRTKVIYIMVGYWLPKLRWLSMQKERNSLFPADSLSSWFWFISLNLLIHWVCIWSMLVIFLIF